MFVTDAGRRSEGTRIFTAPAGLHGHFPLWSPDGRSIYFVKGSLPDQMDIWRIGPGGGSAERITSHNGRVSHPVLLNQRTLAYLATRSGWFRSVAPQRRRRAAHSSQAELGPRPVHVAGGHADGRRLVATLASPKRTLWRLPIADAPAGLSAASAITLTSGTASRRGSVRLSAVCVGRRDSSESIWKLADGNGHRALDRSRTRASSADRRLRPTGSHRVLGPAAGQTLLYAMRADGTDARIVADSLELHGAPAWAPDGLSIASAAIERGAPRLFRVPLDGGAPSRLSMNTRPIRCGRPTAASSSIRGRTSERRFRSKLSRPTRAAHPFPALTLTRGARHLTFLPGRRALVFLRGEIQHKNLWLLDLETGAERQLTDFAPDFEIRDFDYLADGREVVLERVQQHSDVVLLDLPER